MRKLFKISVRNLVELVMRHGSIDNRYMSNAKAIEGIIGHQKVQNSYGDNYEKEVIVKHQLAYEDIDIQIEGRIDGILKEEDKYIIDEIKTTTKELLFIDENYNPLHFAQAKCYGYIFCYDNNLPEIEIQLTYFNIDTENTRIIRKKYSFDELKKDFMEIINIYVDQCVGSQKWIENRNNSLTQLIFPYDRYRIGQRELAVRVYKAIEMQKKCLAQAPTGTGKTISTIFPSLKAMGNNLTSKIFYLTAKTVTRELAEEAIRLLKKQHITLRYVTISAKDKVCMMEETNCNPDYCPYARDYYDRLDDALRIILEEESNFSTENILKFSEKYKLCPFELSLELALYSDIIICDYNYIFDARVFLRRFFQDNNNNYTFLIDEAHNLIDRVRDMYTAEVSQEKVENVKKIYGRKNRKLNNSIKNLLLFMQQKSNEYEYRKTTLVKEKQNDLIDLLNNFMKCTDAYLARSNEENTELIELYFDFYAFTTIYEYYNEENFINIYSYNKELTIRNYCFNPKAIIKDKISLSKSTTLFSATMLPLNYFKDMYGYEEGDYIVNLNNPFDEKNRLVMIAGNISTTYNNREKTVKDIVLYIRQLVLAKTGNYIVFFPSYKYMNLVYEAILEDEDLYNIYMQDNNMTEEDKEDFLQIFKNGVVGKSNVGLCVMGSHFSEGIDLVEDKLIGVIVVGVGMPSICLERDIIKDNINSKGEGFNYAYIYPGIIKVIQAAGRCIRSERDRGVILLIDSRYCSPQYKNLLPYRITSETYIQSVDDLVSKVTCFWNEKI